MRPFLIDDGTKRRLKELADFAEKNPIPIERLQLMIEGKAPPVGDHARHRITLPFDYRIVFSIEEQRKGKTRHLSISVPDKGKYPNPAVVTEVMNMLGFQSAIKECVVTEEEYKPGFFAINVLEYLERYDDHKRID